MRGFVLFSINQPLPKTFVKKNKIATWPVLMGIGHLADLKLTQCPLLQAGFGVVLAAG